MATNVTAEVPKNIEEEIMAMCDSTKEMLAAAREGFRRHDREKLKQAEMLGRQIHDKEKELMQLIISNVSKGSATPEIKEGLSFIPAHFERIGDDIELLVRCIRTMNQEGTLFSERAIREVNTLFAKAIELLECVRDALKTKNKVLIRYIKEEGIGFQDKVNEYALAHQERLIEGICLSKASSVYLAILDYLANVERHIRKMSDFIPV